MQGLIIKKIIDLIMKQLLKQFKLDKIQEYVEMPNELDEKVEKLESKIKKLEKSFSKGKSKLEKIKERF
jgi:chaperonin cofactor prefoldin